MATISIEFRKESSQKTREVYLLVRQGKTRQRVKTGVRLNEQEYSPKTKKIIKKQEKKELEFFAYAEDWVSRAKIKGAKNYLTMLNTLEKFLECRKLFFQEITVTPVRDKKYYCAECFNQNLNIGLKTIGKAVGINKLQFYQARHTFATLSRNLMKFSKGDVDEALNHVGNYEIADVYITKDFSIINDNNFKLLDKVFKNQIPTL